MTDYARQGSFELPVFQAFIGWTSLILVLFSALALGANLPVYWTLLSLAVFLLFTLQIMHDLIVGLSRPATLLWPVAAMYVAVLAWGIAQTIPGFLPKFAHPYWALVPGAHSIISADPIGGVHIVLRLASYGMIFWITLRASYNSHRAMRFLMAIAIFTGALAAFGIWAALSGQNQILGTTDAVVRASFVNRNSYATYAVFSAIANLAVYLHLTGRLRGESNVARRRLRRFLEAFFGGAWIFALGFLLCLAALVLTLSRAGVLAGVVALVIFFIAFLKRSEKRDPLILILPLALVAFSALALTTGVTKRLFDTDLENLRFLIYPLVVEGIEARPLVGHGLGAFENTFREKVPLEAAEAEWNFAHNTYLENFYELGVPAGAVFYFALLCITVIIARGALIRRRNRIIPCMALAVTAGAAFHSVFDFSLEMPAIASLFAAIAGMGWAQSFRRGYVEPR